MLKELCEQLTQKKISPVELLQDSLNKIKAHDTKIHAFVDVEAEQAMQQAKASEARLTSGTRLSPFDGIPLGIKDNIVTKGRETRCGSKILQGFVSPYSATVIEKLQLQGFTTLGRLNMDEFAMGSSTENSAYQVTLNPHDTQRAPGGSSGGSAACVAAGFLPATLGSDTGGSIRQPAAFCGIVGLKPTYGTVSRYGLVAFASSLDQIGPMTRTVADAKLLYNVLKGHDPKDSTSLPANMYKSPSFDLARLRIGYPQSLIDLCDDEVKASFYKLVDFLSKEVVKQGGVSAVELPHQKYSVPVYYLTATSEASANLARFDGVRYGRRSENVKSLTDVYVNSRSEGFGSEVKRRILLGTYALSSGYYDAFYGQAQKVRSLIRQDYFNAFQNFDVILMPTTPSPAFKIGEKAADPVQMYLSDVLTAGASLAGMPVLAVPAPCEKLPIGVQLQGPYFSEEMLFALGGQIEKAFPVKQAVL